MKLVQHHFFSNISKPGGIEFNLLYNIENKNTPVRGAFIMFDFMFQTFCIFLVIHSDYYFLKYPIVNQLFSEAFNFSLKSLKSHVLKKLHTTNTIILRHRKYLFVMFHIFSLIIYSFEISKLVLIGIVEQVYFFF